MESTTLYLIQECLRYNKWDILSDMHKRYDKWLHEKKKHPADIEIYDLLNVCMYLKNNIEDMILTESWKQQEKTFEMVFDPSPDIGIFTIKAEVIKSDSYPYVEIYDYTIDLSYEDRELEIIEKITNLQAFRDKKVNRLSSLQKRYIKKAGRIIKYTKPKRVSTNEKRAARIMTYSKRIIELQREKNELHEAPLPVFYKMEKI